MERTDEYYNQAIEDAIEVAKKVRDDMEHGPSADYYSQGYAYQIGNVIDGLLALKIVETVNETRTNEEYYKIDQKSVRERFPELTNEWQSSMNLGQPAYLYEELADQASILYRWVDRNNGVSVLEFRLSDEYD